jgi:hypothetical protein
MWTHASAQNFSLEISDCFHRIDRQASVGVNIDWAMFTPLRAVAWWPAHHTRPGPSCWYDVSILSDANVGGDRMITIKRVLVKYVMKT